MLECWQEGLGTYEATSGYSDRKSQCSNDIQGRGFYLDYTYVHIHCSVSPILCKSEIVQEKICNRYAQGNLDITLCS